MKGRGKKQFKIVLLVALILVAGSGTAYAYLQPAKFQAGVHSVVEWMKVDMFAEAAEPESSAVPSSSAQSQASEAASSEPEVVTVSLEQAAKPLQIDVSLQKQTVYVWDAEGREVKEFVCSSGESGSETPTGTFTVSDRGQSFYNPSVKEGAYYWVRFYNSYLFHSVPFDENETMEPQEAAKLGTPASHGCIRLATENAKWIYDNIPEGTKVVIQ